MEVACRSPGAVRADVVIALEFRTTNKIGYSLILTSPSRRIVGNWNKANSETSQHAGDYNQDIADFSGISIRKHDRGGGRVSVARPLNSSIRRLSRHRFYILNSPILVKVKSLTPQDIRH